MNRYRNLLRSKIHRASITHSDLNYEGSLTLPPHLLFAADIKEYEAVSIWNVTNGARLETYAIPGNPGSRDICANGAAAHHLKPGDTVIIACFTDVHETELSTHKPLLVYVDKENQILETRAEIPGPLTPVKKSASA